MSTRITYLTISPDDTIEQHEGVLDTADAQDIVEGDIEVLPEPRDISVTVIANEEGKRLGLDANWSATRLLASALRPSDFITGTVIVAGLPDGSGSLTSLTDEQMAFIRETASKR